MPSSARVSSARALWRLGRVLVCVVHCALKCLWWVPRQPPSVQMQEVRLFCTRVLRALDIELEHSGQVQTGPVMLVANHISWLDILAINAVQPARFIAKAEIRRWPVLGWMVACGGTLFLNRERKRDAIRMVGEVSLQLQREHVVAVFPEGTTSLGDGLLPFYPNLLQAAVQAQVPAQAMALRYSDASAQVSSAPAYVDGIHLLACTWSIAKAKDLKVTVQVLPAQPPHLHGRRHDLSAKLRGQIERALGECSRSLTYTPRK